MTPAWHHTAACLTADPAIFFSESASDTAKARSYCNGCPVRGECEAEGLSMSHGVWGGRVRHRVRGVA